MPRPKKLKDPVADYLDPKLRRSTGKYRREERELDLVDQLRLRNQLLARGFRLWKESER